MVLQPGVLKQGLLQPWVFAARGVTIRGSYNQGFLPSGFLQPEVLTTSVLKLRVSYN